VITIRPYTHKRVGLYNPNDEYIGSIGNEVELNDVRIQICQQKLEGYYIMFEDKRINILPNGDCDSWPRGFFDQEMRQIAVLFKLRRGEPYKYDVYET
jgi:predicted ATPase